MKIHTKALLASALIVPGAGQFILKRYKLAVIFFSSALAAITVVLVDVFSKALKITDRILTGDVAPDIAVIRKLINEQQSGSDTQWITIASIVLGVVWLSSIIEVYRQRK